MKKLLQQRWFIAVIATPLAVLLLYLGLCAYMASSLTHAEREPITVNPSQHSIYAEDVSFPSRVDHLTLKGWFIPAPQSPRVLVMVHGKGHHRADPDIKLLNIGIELAWYGYNILMFDLRGHGESEGRRFSLGQYEVRDVQGAVDFLRKRGFAPGKIGLLGWSMGGATVLLAAPDLPEVPALMVDSAYADLGEILDREVPKKSGLPGWFTPGIIGMAQIMYGIDVYKIQPARSLERLNDRAIFIIHGEKDQLVPVSNAYLMYEKIKQFPQNKLWIVPAAGHTDAYKTKRREYTKQVSDFFNQYLGS